jgi:hypothetical protein
VRDEELAVRATDEQIEAMCKAFVEDVTAPSPWDALNERTKAAFRAGMRAALAVLPDVTAERDRLRQGVIDLQKDVDAIQRCAALVERWRNAESLVGRPPAKRNDHERGWWRRLRGCADELEIALRGAWHYPDPAPRLQLTRELAVKVAETYIARRSETDESFGESMEAALHTHLVGAFEPIYDAEESPPDAPTGVPLFDAFRAMVRREIAEELKRDGYHKRFEGACHYSVSLPPVVDWSNKPDLLQRQPEMEPVHTLELYCYVLGPSRTYKWQEPTAEALFESATKEFMGWVAEAAQEREEDSDV